MVHERTLFKSAIWMLFIAVGLGFAESARADIYPYCSNAYGWISASPDTLMEGQRVTLSWDVATFDDGPYTVTVEPGLGNVLASDTQSFAPPSYSGDQTLYLFQNGVKCIIATAYITVLQPVPVYGRTTVHIAADDEAQLFISAVQTPNNTVMLDPGVNLDLSWYESIKIARGVHILGDRSSTSLGPRIYTTTHPQYLFLVDQKTQFKKDYGADDVRISGVRLDGNSSNVIGDEKPTENGIMVYSVNNVEIANSEIYGWTGCGISVQDYDNAPEKTNITNPTSVWIHDNYIHSNRHYGGEGYGVQSVHGAYALIERNVFDENRHAIMGGNDPGSGYLAYKNLVFEAGGEDRDVFGHIYSTHQFDVHGTFTNDFLLDHYLGPAGEFFDYADNTMLYTNGDSLKVRGYPSISAEVHHNVFSKDAGGVSQTDGSNLHVSDNTFDFDPRFALPGDLDGDGRTDIFLPTGRAWWYQSVATGQWHYLAASTKMLPDLVFADVNGDGKTDIQVNSTIPAERLIYSGGGPKLLRISTLHPQGIEELPGLVSNVYWQLPGSTDVQGRQLRAGDVGNPITYPHTLTLGFTLLGTGDFDADGVPDLLLRDAQGYVLVFQLDANGIVLGNLAGRSSTKGKVPPDTLFGGIGDLNGDGRSDIVWRFPDRHVETWFAGEAWNAAFLSANNLTDDPDPVDAAWRLAGMGDFDGDGFSDLYFHDDVNFTTSIWRMHGHEYLGALTFGDPDPSADWVISGFGDFDGDQKTDVLWRNLANLKLKIRFANGSVGYPSYMNGGQTAALEWHVQAVLDTNEDGLADIFWRKDDGSLAIWPMNGANYGSCPTPVGCGSCGGVVQCNGSCSVATPPNFGGPCGSCGGHVLCGGTCSVATPANLGTTCNNCGGTVQCNGSCSPAAPWNLGAPCGNHGTIQCDGRCQTFVP